MYLTFFGRLSFSHSLFLSPSLSLARERFESAVFGFRVSEADVSSLDFSLAVLHMSSIEAATDGFGSEAYSVQEIPGGFLYALDSKSVTVTSKLVNP